MQWFYGPGYDYGRNLPQHREVHGFVLDRASRIRARLLERGAVSEGELREPDPVGEAEVAEVHAPEVVADLHDAFAVSRAVEFDAIGFLPDDTVWGAVVASQLHAAGGTCAALRVAAGVDAAPDWAANLSGGFHHARPDLSHGFCLVNDVAVAVARLRREGMHPRILILDLDLHQGDGNATFFAKDDEVFTVSVHERAIFPTPKATSDLDVGLPGRVGDADYLERLEDVLAELAERPAPEVLIYVSGSDPFAGDPLGSLQLSAEGLARRDRRVAEFAASQGSALVALPAGGYSPESATLTADGFAEIAAVHRQQVATGSGS